MTTTTVMDTAAVDRRDRAPQWREWIRRHFGGLESDFYGDRDYDGLMTSSAAGDTVLTRLAGSRHRVVRDAARARAGDVDYLKIVAPWHGTACVRQFGRTTPVGRGQWIIYDTTAAYEIDNAEPTEHLIVMVPKSAVAEPGLPLPSLMGRCVGGERGISRTALETMRSTWHALPELDDAAARGAGDAITQLVRLSLLELAGHATAVSQRAALRDRIRGYIDRHLRDPDLSVDGIARALNCSRRHLYNAFAGEAESIAGTIQRARLEACVRDLQQTGPYARRITDVALSWGFGNLSHFSRVFREHTGVSPRSFRDGPVSDRQPPSM